MNFMKQLMGRSTAPAAAVILMLVMVAMALPVFAANTTHYPGGISVGTKANDSHATTTPGAGDLFVNGSVESYDGILTLQQGPDICVAVSSINFAYLINVTTGSLVSGTTVWTLGDSPMYNNALSSGAPRTLQISCRNTGTTDAIDVKCGTKTINMSAVIWGINAHLESATETITFSTVCGSFDIGRTSYTGVGHMAWVRVDSMTFSLVSLSSVSALYPDISIMVGTGDGIGILNNVVGLSDIQGGVTLNGTRVGGANYGLDVAKDVLYLTTTTCDNGPFMYSLRYKAHSRQ